MHSALSIPIYCHEDIIGTIDIMTSELVELQDYHHDTIQGITFGLKNSLERITATAQQQERSANARAVNALLQRFQGCSSQHDVIQTALQSVCEIFGWDTSTYWRIDPDRGVLTHETTYGEISPSFDQASRESTFARGVGINGRAWQTRGLIHAEELGAVRDCTRAGIARDSGVHSAVCFPVIVRGEVIGTIDYLIQERIEFSPERLSTIESVAFLTSSAITDFFANDLFQEQRRDIETVRQFVESQRYVTDPQDVIESARQVLSSYLETRVTFVNAPHTHHGAQSGSQRVAYAFGQVDVAMPLSHDG